METMKKLYAWFKMTSLFVGAPVVMLLAILGFQKFAFTTTCYTFDYRCEFAIGATDGMAQYMGDLLASNPNTEIVTKSARR